VPFQHVTAYASRGTWKSGRVRKRYGRPRMPCQSAPPYAPLVTWLEMGTGLLRGYTRKGSPAVGRKSPSPGSRPGRGSEARGKEEARGVQR